MRIHALDLFPQWFQDNVTEAVMGLVTATLAALTAYFKRKLDSIVDHKLETQICPVIVDSSFDAAIEMEESISGLRAILSAVRVLLLVTENGSGIPIGNNAVKSSIIIESFADGNKPVKPFWQKRPTDEVYSQIVRDVYEHGEKILITESLPDCDLRRLYRQGGIGSSAVITVKHTKGRFFYLSVTLPTKHAGEFMNLEQARRVARDLGDVFERNPELSKFIRMKK